MYIHSGTKVFLPKIIYYFSKEMSLDMAGVLEMISECLPEAQKKAFRKCIKGRHDKCIHWLQQNSNFRYVIHENLASQRINFWSTSVEDRWWIHLGEEELIVW